MCLVYVCKNIQPYDDIYSIFSNSNVNSVLTKSFNQLFTNIGFEAFVNVRTNSNQNKAWGN